MITACNSYSSISQVCYFVVTLSTVLTFFLTGANIANYDAARSKIDLPSGDTAAESYWKLFMNDYFAELAKNKNDSVIHYLPKVTEAQKGYPVPTLPPTDLTFQNLPFVKSASDLGRVGENTMLVYLQMTGGHPMPRELLPVSVGPLLRCSLLLALCARADGPPPFSSS